MPTGACCMVALFIAIIILHPLPRTESSDRTCNMRAHTHAIRGAGCCRAGTSHPTPALAFRRRTATALRRPIVVQVAAAASDTAPSPFPETSGDELVKLLRSKANVLVLDVRNPDVSSRGRWGA